MNPEAQIKALAELDGWKCYPAIDGSDAHWICPNEWWHESCPSYLTSYDAIIPLIQKQPLEIRDRIATKGGPISFMATPAQLAEKLLRATNRWTE